MLSNRPASKEASNMRWRDNWWYPYLWWGIFFASMLVTMLVAGCPQL